jgi:signal transduction histidine kinase
MTPQAILILVIFFDASLIYILYSYNPHGAVNRFLCLLLIPITLTNLEMFFLATAMGTHQLDIALNMAILGNVFFFPLLYHFLYFFPRKKRPGRPALTFSFLYGIPLILAIGLLLTFNPGTSIIDLNQAVRQPISLLKTNATYYMFYVMLMIYIVAVLSLIPIRLKKILRLTLLDKERKNLILLSVGFIPLSLFLMFNYLIFQPLKSGMVFFIITAIGYTVFFIFLLLQFGFLDRKALIRVFVVYPILIALLVSLYSQLFYSIHEGLAGFFNIPVAFIQSFEILIFVLALTPLIEYLEKKIGGIFRQSLLNIHQIFTLTTTRLVQIIDLPSLDQELYKLFIGEFHLEQYFLLIRTGDRKYFRIQSKHEKFQPVAGSSEMVKRLQSGNKILTLEQLALSWDGGWELEFLDRQRINLLVPLFDSGDLTAILLLGDPAVTRPWHSQEVKELELFASGLPLVIARCWSYNRAIEMEQKQARIEKLAVLNELALGVAHEIRNPLSIISTSAETIHKKDLSKEDVERLSVYIQEETERVSKLLDRMLSSFRQIDIEHEPTPLYPVVERVFELVGPPAQKKGIHLDLLCPDHSLKAVIDKQVLTQVCLNMLLNAIDALQEKGEIKAELCQNRNQAEIRFVDNGTKIPTAIRSKIFDPFFTTKERGTGLGLSVSRSLVKDADGDLTLIDSKTGNIFQILLPMAGEN